MTKEARLYNGGKIVSSINDAGKTGQLHVKKNKKEIRSFLIPYTKINSKWIKDTPQLLEENIGRTLSDINDSNIFFDSPPRVVEIKTKTNRN